MSPALHLSWAQTRTGRQIIDVHHTPACAASCSEKIWNWRPLPVFPQGRRLLTSAYALDVAEQRAERLDDLRLPFGASFGLLVRRSQKDGNSRDQRSRGDSDPLSTGDHSITGRAEENRGTDTGGSR